MKTPLQKTGRPHSRLLDREDRGAIEVEELCLRYGEKSVFDGVSARIPRGKITALIGPSGCGKTSFLMSLNRLTDLIARCRVAGRVRVGGLDVSNGGTDVAALRRRVGMVFQKPNPFPLSIRRNIELPLRENGAGDRARIAAILEESLRDVGLWDEVKDRLSAPALSLSGGQQQRLCIARALALKPEILLMDEPCSSLDPLASGVVEDLIAGLKGRYTVLIVTHNLAQARRIADDVMVFWVQNEACRLIEHGAAEQVFQAPREAITAAYVRGMRG